MTTVLSTKFSDIKGNLSALQNELYGNCSEASTSRFIKLIENHREHFKSSGVAEMFSAPGRIEITGNHTDHNGGKVLTAAVSVDILAVVEKRNGNIIRVKSEGYSEISVDIRNLASKPEDNGTSTALVRGVLDYYTKKGYKVGAFDASLNSNVPKGAGVSSSSSFEVLVAEILNVLYNDNSISKIEKAKASKYAENEHFKKPCGLMDQAAIALGGINVIDFENAQNPIVTPCQWSFTDLDVFVINTGGDHSDLIADYAGILGEMEAVANYFDKWNLRSCTKQQVLDNARALKDKISGRAVLRALHFFDETRRVEMAQDALKNRDEEKFLKIIRKSAHSSWELLQNLYSPNDREQLIPFAIEMSKECKGVKAARVHGGGFAGTILAFVQKDSSSSYFDKMNRLFGKENVFKLSIRESGARQVLHLEEL
ncbi:MAG TPA: galactokinase family protein [Clostridia bacterium]|nr:galactokinase family protein [Clostridia bacterium]